MLRKLEDVIEDGNTVYIDASPFNPAWSIEDARRKFNRLMTNRTNEDKSGRVYLINEADSAIKNPNFLSALNFAVEAGDKLVWAGADNDDVPLDVTEKFPKIKGHKELIKIELDSYYPKEMWEKVLAS